MRKTQFRGQRATDKTWVFGDLLVRGIDYDYVIRTCQENSAASQVVRIIPETMGEYSGVEDLNLTPIFEGDIVESRISENKLDWKRWKVIFEDGCFAFESVTKSVKSRKKYRFKVNMLCSDEVRFYGLVVVGNIFDNPELLKEDE